MTGRQLENRIALITGAGAGIGKAVVRRFAEHGALVTFTDISEEVGARAVDELPKAGLSATFVQADARAEDETRRLVETLVSTHGRLDIAVNNVGGLDKDDPPGATITDTSYEAWKSTIDFSLSATFLAMKYELLQMVKQGGGVIVNTSSTAGLRVTKTATPAYNVAKIGVLHLTRTAAVQYARNNIRVNAVAPGFTLTEAVKSYWSEDEREIHCKGSPRSRFLEPGQLADAFLFLCSDQSSGVSGVVLPVDDGLAVA